MKSGRCVFLLLSVFYIPRFLSSFLSSTKCWVNCKDIVQHFFQQQHRHLAIWGFLYQIWWQKIVVFTFYQKRSPDHRKDNVECLWFHFVGSCVTTYRWFFFLLKNALVDGKKTVWIPFDAYTGFLHFLYI